MPPSITTGVGHVNTYSDKRSSLAVNNVQMNPRDHFPARLKQLRLRAGLSQTQLAEKCGWGQSRISNYESGRDPQFSELFTLAAALGAPVHELFRNPDGHDEWPSQAERIDPTMLIEAERNALLLEGKEPDLRTAAQKENWLHRIAAMYNLAMEDGGRISVDRLRGLMEASLAKRDGGSDEARGEESSGSGVRGLHRSLPSVSGRTKGA